MVITETIIPNMEHKGCEHCKKPNLFTCWEIHNQVLPRSCLEIHQEFINSNGGVNFQ